MLITDAIKKICRNCDLDENEIASVMQQIMEGRATDAQIASFLTALKIKGETVDEITGAARVMLSKSLNVPVVSRENLVDIVGTGGDMSGTFNISTASAFVACGAGLKIAKHGNRSASGSCGSADVIEKLGINIELEPEMVARCIDSVGIGFLFAPKMHVAMKHASAVRREIKIRTIFNILGPLTNPANASLHLIGVFEEKLTRIFAGVLQKLGKKKAFVVYGRDGLDEISLGSETVVSELADGNINTFTITSSDFGLGRVGLDEITGGNAGLNASIIMDLLQGQKGPHRDVVLANCAAALVLSGRAETFRHGAEIAAESIDSGMALKKLNELKELSRNL